MPIWCETSVLPRPADDLVPSVGPPYKLKVALGWKRLAKRLDFHTRQFPGLRYLPSSPADAALPIVVIDLAGGTQLGVFSCA
jgi:hypothetical protein